MKKRYKNALVMFFFLICILLVYSFFHVNGSEINDVEKITSTCTVTIIKYQHMEWENRVEYVLKESQIQQLKNHLLESSFTRVLSWYVVFKDKDMYEIQIDFNNNQDFLDISCIGNEYISVTNQFNGKHLKINNLRWKLILEEIINS